MSAMVVKYARVACVCMHAVGLPGTVNWFIFAASAALCMRLLAGTPVSVLQYIYILQAAVQALGRIAYVMRRKVRQHIMIHNPWPAF